MTPALSLCEALGEALELEVLAEVRQRLFDLTKVPRQLFRVHVEVVAGTTPQCRASLQLTDGGLNLLAALRAREVDLVVVKQALGHSDLSVGLHLGDDAASAAVETPSPTTRTGGEA